MSEYQYSVIYTPAEEGGYVITCPALPGVITEGDSLEEARAMAQEAVRAYLESLQKDGLPIPADKPPPQEEIHVLLPEAS
jgi:predicted RNase H-like HicB family nuclease